MHKNQKEEQSELRQWLELLCSDPYASILDETIFHVDVLETTEDYIIEAELSHCQKENIVRVSQDFVENIFSVHYGRCKSLVSEPFSGIHIVSAFGLSSLILRR
uniref:Uncharacterized protein n=1 Tax=Geobacillus sp. (strain WCH70) TaxID=471223 RepID=C5D9M0_GEOSW